jgi:pyrroline-5-carboxylate reductase
MKNARICFIGGGNMAASLIGGLIADHYDPQHITVADIDAERLAALGARFGINTQGDNHLAMEGADVVVLAVKPQILKEVAGNMADAIQSAKPLVVSVAAGIRAANLNEWLGGGTALVRTMPNTPALVQTGATALYANEQVSAEQREQAECILRTAGLTLWVEDEAQMDAVTALSGSGPAYFFRIMEALEKAGSELGLPAETARLLTLQTALGAAKMALESNESVATLRERVTSPGGTTEQGLRVLEEHDIDELMARVLEAARDRSQELAKLLGEG